MSDVVEKIGNSTVQHGPFNDRVYLMHLDPADGPEIVDRVLALATGEGRSKIFAKVVPQKLPWFVERGFELEAQIPPGPFSDGLCFACLYLDQGRAGRSDAVLVDGVLERVRTDGRARAPAALPVGLRVEAASPHDTPAIAALYRRVFESYPFPIHEEAFLTRCMAEGIRYYTVRSGDGTIVAVSSAEPAEGGTMLEMTDFATDPAYRGQGLARHLLRQMDAEAQQRGVAVAFTIARAPSLGINLTFHRSGYRFGGTLINNTNISGSLESMNVWYRHLAPVSS